ncbi:MAG: LemA family protein [Candidatus Altiarchaeota archaeon]|nr:LemA family protein [Candidatus Altiarchaeota archaeon]
MALISYVIIGLLSVVLLYIASVYNRFVGLKNGIENSFNQIRVAMKKRLDMIGQLVDTTKSSLKFEKSVLTDVTKMRNLNLGGTAELEKADAMAKSVFGRLIAVAENYPKIQGMEPVKELQASIKSVEDEISRLRYLYNDQVQTFNVLGERLPTNIVASLLGFGKKAYLKFGEEIEKRPDTKVF